MANTSFHQIKYLLFDCDNTLVQTEALAFAGCASLVNEILASHGLSYRYSGQEMQRNFVGMNFRALISSLASIHGFTLSHNEIETYSQRELQTIISMIRARAEPCVNANDVLQRLQQQSAKYGMAVVSSSALSRVRASLKKAGQEAFFDEDKIFSAATSLPVPTSKPDPAIYLYACEQLAVQPNECLAVEDSKSGATAAMRAGIPVLGYVGAYEDEKEKMEIDIMLRRDCKAKEVMWDWKDFEAILAKLEARHGDVAG